MKSATSKSIRPVTPTHKRSFDPEDRIFRYTLKNRQAKSIVIHSPDSHKTDSIAKEGEIHSPMFKRSKSNGPLDCTDKNNKSRERRRWNEEAYIEWKIESFSKSNQLEQDLEDGRKIIAGLMADKAKMQSDLKANETSISTLNNLLKSQQLKIDELAFKLKKLYDALKLAESHLDEERIAVSRYNLINQELEKDLNSLKLKLKEMRQSEAFKNKQENEETKKVRGKYLTLLEELRASDIWILKLLAYLKNGDISEAIDMILGKQKLIQIRVETTEKELQMLRADIFFGRANAFKFPSNTPYMIPQKNHKRSSSISPLRSRQQIPVDHRRMESYSKPYDLDRGLY